MKDYSTPSYIYPPRPATVAPPTGIGTYERMGFIAQPKMNGSCAVLFLDGSSSKLMGRHNNTFAREIINREDLKRLHRGAGWMVLVGEYMNKSQKDSKGKPFNGFVIFDILVLNGKHLVGTTFLERQQMLDSLYVSKPYDDYIDSVGSSAFRARNFRTDLKGVWEKLTKVQMYEGFVLKRPDGILENGFRESNNTGWQLKIRKPTKNYKY
jgi:hypothetical protein